MIKKDDAIRMLKSRIGDLKNIGIFKIGIFGSVARGDNSAESDIDIFAEFSPGESKSRNFNKLCDLLDELFSDNYDLVTKGGLSPYSGDQILREVEYVSIAS